MAKVVVVISYDTDRMPYPEKLVRRIAQAIHPIFMRKSNVEIGMTQDDNAHRVLEVLADESEDVGYLQDPVVRPREWRKAG